MNREFYIGEKINDWTVISEPFGEGSKNRVTLKCICGRECTYEVRTINRANFSKACKGCGQIERHKRDGRIYNVGDIIMNLKILKIYSGKNTSYLVECLTCGNIYHSGHWVLVKKNKGLGLPYCKKCLIQNDKRQKKTSMYTEHISFGCYNTLESQARMRGIEFMVTPEYLEKIFNGYCYISGLPITIGTKSRKSGNNDLGTASLDRIDSSLGYIEENVAWCYKKINIMKHTSTLSDFINMCKIITDNWASHSCK